RVFPGEGEDLTRPNLDRGSRRAYLTPRPLGSGSTGLDFSEFEWKTGRLPRSQARPTRPGGPRGLELGSKDLVWVGERQICRARSSIEVRPRQICATRSPIEVGMGSGDGLTAEDAGRPGE